MEGFGEFSLTKSFFGFNVVGKLGNMRKPQSFSVQPLSSGGEIVVQSEKSIGRLDYHTGKGVLNTKGCYFPHLLKVMGAVDFDFPPDFVKAVLAACPALDSETTVGGITILNTIKVI